MSDIHVKEFIHDSRYLVEPASYAVGVYGIKKFCDAIEELSNSVDAFLAARLDERCGTSFSRDQKAFRLFKKGVRESALRDMLGRMGDWLRGFRVKKAAVDMVSKQNVVRLASRLQGRIWEGIRHLPEGVRGLLLDPKGAFARFVERRYSGVASHSSRALGHLVRQEAYFWIGGSALEISAAFLLERLGVDFFLGLASSMSVGMAIANLRRLIIVYYLGRDIALFANPSVDMCQRAREFEARFVEAPGEAPLSEASEPKETPSPLPEPSGEGAPCATPTAKHPEESAPRGRKLNLDPDPSFFQKFVTFGGAILLSLLYLSKIPSNALPVLAPIGLGESSEEELFFKYRSIYEMECADNPSFSRMCRYVVY